MNRVFVKNTGENKGEAWVEAWLDGATDWEVVCRSKVMFMGNKVLVDTLDTPVKYRRKGFATELVKYLQANFEEVTPIGITTEGKPFWDKLGMTDGLGEER